MCGAFGMPGRPLFDGGRATVNCPAAGCRCRRGECPCQESVARLPLSAYREAGPGRIAVSVTREPLGRDLRHPVQADVDEVGIPAYVAEVNVVSWKA